MVIVTALPEPSSPLPDRVVSESVLNPTAVSPEAMVASVTVIGSAVPETVRVALLVIRS